MLEGSRTAQDERVLKLARYIGYAALAPVMGWVALWCLFDAALRICSKEGTPNPYFFR